MQFVFYKPVEFESFREKPILIAGLDKRIDLSISDWWRRRASNLSAPTPGAGLQAPGPHAGFGEVQMQKRITAFASRFSIVNSAEH